MGEDWGSWFPRQLDWQSPNSQYSGAPFNLEQQYSIPSFVNSGTGMVSLRGNLPVYPYIDQPQPHAGQQNESHRWFYCMPRFRQAFAPLHSGLKEKHSTAPCVSLKETIAPKAESGCCQKKFLVFDQSGDQTTLIFSSGIGTPVQGFSSRGPNLIGAYNLKREDPGTKLNLNVHLGSIEENHFGENDLQSEMREDTEELNALLYSDDSTEDDEVTSTGHSPSTMTAHCKQDWVKGSTEEVASSDGLTKKRKLFSTRCSNVPALMDTATSKKSVGNLASESEDDDAESRCDNRVKQVSTDMGSECSSHNNKRMRKEKIRETVSILQNIIPGGKGKDTVVVIDEAINYLKSLKLKAKALGLDAPYD